MRPLDLRVRFGRKALGRWVVVFIVLFMAPYPTMAQPNDGLLPLHKKRFCTSATLRYRPLIDQLLADETTENRLTIAYNLVLNLNIVEEECKTAPQDNPYQGKLAEAVTDLNAELATDSQNRCGAVANDIYKKSQDNSRRFRNSIREVSVNNTAYRRVIETIQPVCPASLKPAFKQVTDYQDRIDQAMDAWPICQDSRKALEAEMAALKEGIQDPRQDPETLAKGSYQEAVASFRAACAFDPGWTADKQAQFDEIDTMIAARTPDVRQACEAALVGLKPRLDAIDERSLAYQPGCTDILSLKLSNSDDDRAIETAFEKTCALFNYEDLESLKNRYSRSKRLIQELEAEHATATYRLSIGETDVVNCRP